MKKALSLVLAVLMMMSLLSISASADDKVVIEFWNTHGETFGGPAVTKVVEWFNENNDLGVEIRQVVYTGYDEIATNLQSAILANTAPALSTCSYSNINYLAQNFPYLSRSGYNAAFLCKGFRAASRPVGDDRGSAGQGL